MNTPPSSISSTDTAIHSGDSPEIVALKKLLADRNRELAWEKLRTQSLEARLRKLLLDKYGPASEKLSDEQLSLLEFEPGVSQEEIEGEAGRDAGEMRHRPRRNQAAKPHPGRQTLPAGLPRVEEIVKVPESECFCAACHGEMAVIGYEESEQLDVKPAEYFVRVIKREKRACGACGQGGVKSAPVEASIVEKSLVSSRVIVETIVAKYLDHLPLYRQSAILMRDAGVEIHRSTMCGWVARVGELLAPIAEAMRRELLAGDYLQADETPVKVQMHDGRGKNHQAYLWQYSRPGGVVLFDFRMSRGREGPKRMLERFEGILQTDGYAAYKKVGGPLMVRAACWAHARRKYFEAAQLNQKDRAAVEMVERIDALFAIDAVARQAGLSIERRHGLRAAQAQPLVEAIGERVRQLRASTLPASALGKALSYTLGQWAALTVFLDHPVVELSNNLAENSMRGVALGRKNWIHVGDQSAGPKLAAILSIAETCRRAGIPVREYLLAVLPGMADRKLSDVANLTPTRWKARQA